MVRRESSPLIVRQQTPDNREGPPEVFETPMTPTERFFVRNHFDVPDLDADSWSLQVDGAVDRSRSWGLDDLQRFDQKTVTATLECAGNGRAQLGDRASGVAWQQGAIGTASWRGVVLSQLLDETGLDDGVEELIFVGADRGPVETADGGSIQTPYARSLPVEKAMSDDVIIATAMNGEPLTPEHGYPGRLLVAGWYGMASVKWLVRILAIPDHFQGYFQTEDYAIWEYNDGLPVRCPLGSMAVKSHIGHPVDGQRLTAGDTVTIEGFAWGGEGSIDVVEVSVDGGDTYSDADLLDSPHRHSWQRWSYTWEVPQDPKQTTLLSRARTDEGEVQPRDHDWRKGAYEVNMIRPVDVVISE